MELALHTEQDPSGSVVTTVIGDLHTLTVAQLGEHLEGQELPCDVLDLRYVQFLTAAGVRAVLASRAHTVVCSPLVLHTLRLCGIESTLKVTTPDRPPNLHHALGVVAVRDRDLRITYANDAFSRVTGIPVSAMIGRRNEDLVEFSENPTRELLERVVESRRSLQRTVQVDIGMNRNTLRCRFYPILDAGVLMFASITTNPAGEALPLRATPIVVD